MEGVAKVDTVCAADLIALRDAVRFDLNVDLSRGRVRGKPVDLEVALSKRVGGVVVKSVVSVSING
jgi:hypothetical protein